MWILPVVRLFIVLIYCYTEFKRIFHSDGNKTHNQKISVLTLNGRHAHVIPLDTPSLTLLSLSLFLSLPSYPTFPSHPWGVLCATAETTDGAQHHPQSEREGQRENRGRLHSLFTSLGIGILMLKAIGQPFIKLTGDVGKETRG